MLIDFNNEWSFYDEDSPVYSHKIIGIDVFQECELTGSATKHYNEQDARFIWRHLICIGWVKEELPLYGYPLIGSGIDPDGLTAEIRARVDRYGNITVFHVLRPVTQKMKKEIANMEVIWERAY